MNDNAHALKLLNTFFDSPHGLMNPQNVSTAYDMARLTSICMQYPIFRRLVGTKTFQCRGMRSYQKPLPTQSRREMPAANKTVTGASYTSSSCEGESSEQSSSVDEKFETVYLENGY